MSELVICPTCEKLRHRQRPKGCITLASTLIGLRRSAVNPTIDQLPDRAVVIFSDISMSLARLKNYDTDRDQRVALPSLQH